MKSKYKPNFEFLDEEERELEHLDPSTALPDEEKNRALKAFHRAVEGGVRKAVTMRLSEATIKGLKKKAEADGIPYQTLASMILRKYVRGSLLDKDAVKEVVKALQKETAPSR
jgi:predicted DNA binding CopG/RHH family protein